MSRSKAFLINMIMTIHFKNGTKKEISQDIAETLLFL